MRGSRQPPRPGDARRRVLRALAALALTAAAALSAPAASPAAVTIGSTLANPGATTNVSNCGGALPCTYVQTFLNPANQAPGGLASPMDGVVVRWRLKAGSAGGAVGLRVLRPASGPSFTGAGTSATETANVGVNTWSTRLPIELGDRLGLNNASSGLYFAPSPGAEVRYWSPFLPDGTTAPSLSASNNPLEMLLNADVEPDVDRDGFGDETQDACPRSALTQGPCPTQRCELEQQGTAAGETINGSQFGDRIAGRGGGDVLRGFGGEDCLDGGDGNDTLDGGDGSDALVGGRGRDVILGGSGGDTINGGRGKNRISAGSGNDRINARNGRRDSVNCGGGRRDRVRADRSDRLRRCERVRR